MPLNARFIVFALLLTSLGIAARAAEAPPRWTVLPVATLEGFAVPECALWSAADGRLYVSNIESEPGAYWEDDGKGYISTVDADTKVQVPRWLDSRKEAVVDSPKGMCRLGEYLYFTDNTRLLRCPVKTPEKLEVFAKGFTKANDLATDGKEVWVSDNGSGQVFAYTPAGKRREVPSPAGVNGVTCSGGRVFAVSWELHEVYELDPAGKNAPRAYGLADHFTNLDGIEVLSDGSILVSDFMGDKISMVTPDGKSAYTLVRLRTPADIGIDRAKGLLYVPLFMENQLVVLKLQAPKTK